MFNVGSGKGISIAHLLKTIEHQLSVKLDIKYFPGRSVDVPVNYLDISRYENTFGSFISVPLEKGIRKTADHLWEAYSGGKILI